MYREEAHPKVGCSVTTRSKVLTLLAEKMNIYLERFGDGRIKTLFKTHADPT
jgi:hypothetical protein